MYKSLQLTPISPVQNFVLGCFRFVNDINYNNQKIISAFHLNYLHGEMDLQPSSSLMATLLTTLTINLSTSLPSYASTSEASATKNSTTATLQFPQASPPSRDTDSQALPGSATDSFPQNISQAATSYVEKIPVVVFFKEISPTPVAPANTPQVAQTNKQITGTASWYGPGFHGRRTANGERFNQNALTAAHRTLRFGTRVKVTNLRNNRSVVVRINDRGPYSGGRIIDLSAAAAREIGMINSGVARVRIEVLN